MTEAVVMNLNYRVDLFLLDRKATAAHSATPASYAASRGWGVKDIISHIVLALLVTYGASWSNMSACLEFPGCISGLGDRLS